MAWRQGLTNERDFPVPHQAGGEGFTACQSGVKMAIPVNIINLSKGDVMDKIITVVTQNASNTVTTTIGIDLAKLGRAEKRSPTALMEQLSTLAGPGIGIASVSVDQRLVAAGTGWTLSNCRFRRAAFHCSRPGIHGTRRILRSGGCARSWLPQRTQIRTVDGSSTPSNPVAHAAAAAPLH